MRDTGEQRGGADAEVVCSWCGGLIRRGVAKAARRMCQPCFARMMDEYERAHRQDDGRRYASGR